MTSPLFSVIIPTFDRPQPLAACLDALAATTLPPSAYEVIVVDDGGAIDPAPVVARLAPRLPVRLLAQPHRGPAAARNTGVAAAHGHLLAFTDDDCLPSPTWLERLAERFDQQPDAAIGGRTLNALVDNPFARASQTLNHYLYDYYLTTPRDNSFIATNNLAVPRARFLALGGFATGFVVPAAEDREFCNRWRHHGSRLVFAPEVIVYHAHHLTLSGFMRQHFNYGRGAHHYHRARAAHHQPSVKLEPLAFYHGLLRYPFRQGGGKAIGQAILLAFSQAVYAAGYFGERMAWNRKTGAQAAHRFHGSEPTS